MANGSIIVNNGKTIILSRSYDSTATETVPSRFSVGISNGTPDVADTALDVRIPISDGTVNDDGDNQMTGSNGGANSTDNTSTFKPGAGVSDDVAQNLVTDGLGANATKTWTITDLSVNGVVMTATEPFALWLYIDDAADLAKFVAAGTALEIRLGSDSTNYYKYERTLAQLAVGWNWITSGTVNVEDLDVGMGAPGAPIDYFEIEVTTANVGDEFNVAVAGELVYDLLRQWATSDIIKTYESGYPALDTTNHEVEIRCQLLSTQANGFELDGFALYNTDGTPLMHSEDTFTDESKSNTDQFTFIVKDRLI